MSRHVSRDSRWTYVNAKEHRSAFGVVRYVDGAWEGTVTYQAWNEETRWQDEATDAGRFKRPRNAMIAVEGKARELQRRLGDKVKVAFEE